MDLTEIKSIETLESLAYRQILTMEQSKQNLANIQQRIAQLEQAPKVAKEDSSNEA
jgi:hypothetical protein